jgi:hypothetical protein
MSDRADHKPPDTSAAGVLKLWIAACLRHDIHLPADDLPLDLAEAEGVLPWLAWRLQEAELLDRLPPAQQQRLRDGLRLWAMMHLDCDAQLERLAQSAQSQGLRFIVFKGHSVARTLYPHPACRPTSDFDLLIERNDVGMAREWLESLGYEPFDPFAGTVWLGQQAWTLTDSGGRRFAVDLHWDYSNRMYFRNRLPFAALWSASQTVPCGGASLRVPSPADDLLLACVHLAAHDRELPVVMRWLLDIYLLMSAVPASDIPDFLGRAGRARAIEACLTFGEQAAALGEPARLEAMLGALREAADERRWQAFERTLRWRAWDLLAFWARLGAGDKLAFFGDMARWVKVR